ncbi:MAG: ATP-binding cassette domain-containing protein [Ruminococcus sp.]
MLSFDHVTFSYPGGGESAIQDISFTLNAGETLGIIGGTGNGKSTIANLIPRFYDTTEGTVLGIRRGCPRLYPGIAPGCDRRCAAEGLSGERYDCGQSPLGRCGCQCG